MELLDYRMKWAEDNFYIEKKNISTLENYKIVQRKNYFGVDAINDDIIIDTLFDDAAFVSPTLTRLLLLDKWGFYDLKRREWVISPICESYSLNSKSIECVVDGRKGLIDTVESRLVIDTQYEKVTNNVSQKYLWVKKNGLYHYIEKSSGVFLCMPNAKYAYDNAEALFILKDERVICVDTRGCQDIKKFREILVKNNGRLKLENFRDHIIHIVDIYGNILN